MKKIALFCALLCGMTFAFAHQPFYYPSVDQHGDTLTLSGAISLPTNAAKGIILNPHYTIFSNDEAPSNKLIHDAVPFKDDYVILQPDLIGYGITADRAHPYLAGELTARNTVDMLLAAQPMLDSLQLGIPTDSIYILGFSQGGSSAVWTLKLIEQEYADRIHVIACFAGAGPHDVAATFDESKRTGRVSIPVLIPLLVIGTDAAYDLGLDRAHFFTPALEKKYIQKVKDKKFNGMQLYFDMGNHRLRHWLTSAALDNEDEQSMRLYEGLVRSSMVHDTICTDWIPSSPIYIYHSIQDDVVTFVCAENLRKCFGEQPNITYDFGKYGGHLKSRRPFFDHVQSVLNQKR